MLIKLSTWWKIAGNNLNTQNSIQEKIKSRLKSWNICYHSVQNLLSSSLLYIQNYNFACCCVWVWSLVFLTLREERRLRVFENWVLRKIFGPKRDENRRMEKN